MEFTTLQLEQQPAVWRVRLNRPQLANAMSLTMVEELLALMNSAQQADCRVLVIEGNGDHFCAGGDIKDMQAAGGDSARLAEFNRAFGHMIETANRLPAVVICALKGAVMGGGFGLACWPSPAALPALPCRKPRWVFYRRRLLLLWCSALV